MDLSQFDIGNGDGKLTIPGLESLQNMFTTVMAASLVIGALFVVLYIINLVQRIRADRAMIAMQKDIAAIKALLIEQVQATAINQVQSDSPLTPAPSQSEQPEPIIRA